MQGVDKGSPADEAGLQAGNTKVGINGQQITADGDVITAVDGQKITGMDDLIASSTATSPATRSSCRSTATVRRTRST